MTTLFLGNSFTKSSKFDVPSLIDQLAANVGIRHESLAELKICIRGGMPLSCYLNDKGGKLAQYLESKQPPTHIVLQEQSCKPWRSPTKFREAVQGIVTKFRNDYPNVTIILYQTQCWKDLDAKHCPNYPQQLDLLLGGYERLAQELDIELAPVGTAVETMRTEKLQWETSAKDGKHPSHLTAYLAACLLFGVLTGTKVAEFGPGYNTLKLTLEQIYYVHELADRTIMEHRNKKEKIGAGDSNDKLEEHKDKKRKKTQVLEKESRKKQR